MIYNSEEYLKDPIKLAFVKPSGSSPALQNPKQLENQKGQEGQVDETLKHFNHKVIKLADYKLNKEMYGSIFPPGSYCDLYLHDF